MFIEVERMQDFLVNALRGNLLEDLLESSRVDCIPSDVHLLLLRLDQSKQVANSLVFLGHTDLKEVTALLDDTDLSEDRRYHMDEL